MTKIIGQTTIDELMKLHAESDQKDQPLMVKSTTSALTYFIPVIKSTHPAREKFWAGVRLTAKKNSALYYKADERHGGVTQGRPEMRWFAVDSLKNVDWERVNELIKEIKNMHSSTRLPKSVRTTSIDHEINTEHKSIEHPFSDDYDTVQYQKLVTDTFQRDNHTCQWCGDTETWLKTWDVHFSYKKSPITSPLEDLITICEDCYAHALVLHPKHDLKYKNLKVLKLRFTQLYFYDTTPRIIISRYYYKKNKGTSSIIDGDNLKRFLHFFTPNTDPFSFMQTITDIINPKPKTK